MNRFQSFIGLFLLLLITFSSCRTDPKRQDSEVAYQRTSNEVFVRLRAEPEGLNPLMITGNYASQIVEQIFIPLITLDPQTFEFIPALIKSRPKVTEITEGPFTGGLAYTFEILDEAVWDNGTPVTGNDYVFTLKAVLNPLVPAQRIRSFMAYIGDVAVDEKNPKKFTVFAKEKYFLNEEAISNSFGVMPAYAYDPNGLMQNFNIPDLQDAAKVQQLVENDARLKQFADEFNSEKFAREKGFVVGCGPYQFEEWTTGQRIVLTKKANWWGDKISDKYPALIARPDRLVYFPVPDDGAAAAALKAEEMDAVPDISPNDFLEMRDAAFTQERYNFYAPPNFAYAALYMNNNNPKLSDRRVRRAIAHAINVDEIIETVYNGFAERAVVPVHPSSMYFNENLKSITFSIENAKGLLKEAGWADTNSNGTVDKMINGEIVELMLECMLPSASETGRNMLLLAQGTLQQAGIGLEIIPREFGVIMEDVRADNFEMASGGRTISPSLWEPAQDWLSASASGGSNYANMQNAAVDALIEQIQVTLDDAKRNELYKQLQALIYEEQPYIFMFHPTLRLAIHKRFDMQPSSAPPGFFTNSFDLNIQ